MSVLHRVRILLITVLGAGGGADRLPPCPAHWQHFNSSCYRGIHLSFIASFSAAERLCRAEGAGAGSGHLPSVHSGAELNWLVELGARAGWFGRGRGVYLGGVVEPDLSLAWLDGTEYDYRLVDPAPGHCLAVFSSLLPRQVECGSGPAVTPAADFVICRLNPRPAPAPPSPALPPLTGVPALSGGLAVLILLLFLVLLLLHQVNCRLDCRCRHGGPAPRLHRDKESAV